MEPQNPLGDNVEGDKIGRQINMGDDSTYIENQHLPLEPIPHALTPLPFLPEFFVGRENDLTTIHARLCAPNGNMLLLVNGDGGVGKTSLAAKYMLEYQDKYSHIAWVLSEKSIANALLLVLAPPLKVVFDDHMNTAQRLHVLLTKMANLQKPCLLVVDNANELNDLEANYQQLRRCNNFHLLLTTRIRNFSSASTFSIEGLPETDALQLFEKYYRPLAADEQALFLRIRTAVGANTLVLELFAKTLALKNQLKHNAYTLADLLTDLQQRGLLQLPAPQPVHTDYQSMSGQIRHETPEAIIGTMYDLAELNPEEMAMLSVFAVLPAERISFDTLQILLPDSPQLNTHLPQLAQKGWIEFSKADTDTSAAFKCSPVVQEVVKSKNQNLSADCALLIDVLNKKLAYQAGVGHFLNASYFEALVFARYAEAALASSLKPDSKLSVLADRVGRYYQTTGNLERALFFYNKGAQIDEALCSAEPNNSEFKDGLAISYSKLGETYGSLGNLKQALTFFKKQNQLAAELHTAHPQDLSFKKGLAISYSKLGNTHSALGNLEKALTFFDYDLKLSIELYAAHPQDVKFKNDLANSYEILGNTYSALGNQAQALAFFKKSTALMEDLYAAHPQDVKFKNDLGTSYFKLGETYSVLGDLEQALTFFDDETTLFKELHASYPLNASFKNRLAISYGKLGEMHRELGNLEEALIFFDHEITLFKEMYSSHPKNVCFKNGLAISYAKLGQFNRDNLKDLSEAKNYFQLAEQHGEELLLIAPQHIELQRFLEAVRRDLQGME